ncbi:SagB/ThcOx family dehydrogenase [Streptosporangium sp. NPDC051023]|uniref:SagB/ThcOx family dehydrogenase n=1 Tax=Streptosporangium sp. NPDC051023 TaxID=3155410 RepID=UPI00344B161D
MDSDNSAVARAAISANFFRAASPWLDSTAFRTNQLRHAHLGLARSVSPAEEFLCATRLRRHDRETQRSAADYLTPEATEMLSHTDEETVPASHRVDLPDSAPARMPIDQAIALRRSVRLFDGRSATLPEVAALLRAAGAHLGHPPGRPHRAVPSGGGLYPVELHIAARDVTGIGPGLYRYAPRLDVLHHYGDAEDLAAFLRCGVEEFPELLRVDRAALVILLVGRPWRSMRKYGPRGLRFVLHEVGAMSEHIHLTATALGLGSTDWSTYFDDEANEVLGADGLRTALLHLIILGRPETSD